MLAFDTPVGHYLRLVEKVDFDGGTGCQNGAATFIKAVTLIIRNPAELEPGGPPKVVGSPQAFGVAWTPSAAALGFNGTGGPVLWRNHRTALSTLWARSAIYPSQSTLHNPRAGTWPSQVCPEMQRCRLRRYGGPSAPGDRRRSGSVPWLSGAAGDRWSGRCTGVSVQEGGNPP